MQFTPSYDSPIWDFGFGDSLGEETGIIVGSNGLIYRRTPSLCGTGWVKLASGIPDTIDLKAVVHVQNGTWLALGSEGNIWTSEDDGQTWPTMQQAKTLEGVTITAEYNSVVCVNSTYCFAAGDSGKAVATNDGGKTWWEMLTPAGYKLRDIHFVTDQVGHIVGDYGSIFRTINGGHAWYVTKQNRVHDFYSVYFITPDEGMVAGRQGFLFRTTDGAVTWNRVDLYTRTIFWAVTCTPDASQCLLAASLGDFRLSIDRGVSWRLINIGMSLPFGRVQAFAPFSVGAILYEGSYYRNSQAPTVSSSDPSVVGVVGDFPIEVSGFRLNGGTITLGGEPCAPGTFSADGFTCITPPLPAGNVEIIVTHPVHGASARGKAILLADPDVTHPTEAASPPLFPCS